MKCRTKLQTWKTIFTQYTSNKGTYIQNFYYSTDNPKKISKNLKHTYQRKSHEWQQIHEVFNNTGHQKNINKSTRRSYYESTRKTTMKKDGQ